MSDDGTMFEPGHYSADDIKRDWLSHVSGAQVVTAQRLDCLNIVRMAEEAVARSMGDRDVANLAAAVRTLLAHIEGMTSEADQNTGAQATPR